jgi:ketosteroid isomerase-like protein
MNRVPLLALSLLLPLSVVLVVSAQTDPTQAQIRAAENSWNNAEQNHDAKTLSRLMSDDLVLTEPDGNVINKTAEVAFTADPTTHFDLLESHDLRIQVHGEAAVVSGAYHEKGTYQGKSFEHRGRFTDTWIRNNGKWQCIAGHFSVSVPD